MPNFFAFGVATMNLVPILRGMETMNRKTFGIRNTTSLPMTNQSKFDINGNCPRCNESWDAGPIPEKYLGYYGGETRYSKLILVKMQGIDSASDHWRCPHCNATFERRTVRAGGR
jgi:transposase-like protein